MLSEYEIETSWSRSRKARIAGRFLKGPIPLSLIAKAAKLPGQSLTVLLAIYHQTALTGNVFVTLPKGLMTELGVSRDGKARALHSLETAAIVTVERCRGRTARVKMQSLATSAGHGGQR
jgi:hypothetical protein